jgi:hypothetical protein
MGRLVETGAGGLMYELWWMAEDGRSSLSGGEYDSLEAAQAAQPKALAEALEAVGEECRQGILAGSWSICWITEDEDGDEVHHVLDLDGRSWRNPYREAL